jgi:hypothetical protein
MVEREVEGVIAREMVTLPPSENTCVNAVAVSAPACTFCVFWREIASRARHGQTYLISTARGAMMRMRWRQVHSATRVWREPDSATENYRWRCAPRLRRDFTRAVHRQSKQNTQCSTCASRTARCAAGCAAGMAPVSRPVAAGRLRLLYLSEAHRCNYRQRAERFLGRRRRPQPHRRS